MSTWHKILGILTIYHCTKGLRYLQLQHLNFWKEKLEPSFSCRIIYFMFAKKRFALVTNIRNIYDIAQRSRVSDKTTISRQCFPVRARGNLPI